MGKWLRIIKRNGGIEYSWGCFTLYPMWALTFGRVTIYYYRDYRRFSVHLWK